MMAFFVYFSFMEKLTKNIEVLTIDEFRGTGLLFFINALLHAFGMVIIYSKDTETGEEKLLPARTKFRGWDEKSQDEEHEKIANYLAHTAPNFPEEIR